MHLNRTTTRALAASVALVAAGGTVAGAAVFHIPVLGFGAVNAGATGQVAQVANVASEKPIAPRRVVKTRFVDQIVHHQAAASHSRGYSSAPSATVAAQSGAPMSPSTTAETTPPPSTNPPVTTPPVTEPPTTAPPQGDDGHESDHGGDHGGDDEHGGSTSTTAAANR